MSGELCYFTIGVRDASRARAFYGDLFGWRFQPGSVPEGFQIEGATPPGGLHGGGGPGVRVYFTVDDVAAAVARIRQLGGHADEPQESASGAYADCRDDQGVHFSIWAPPRAAGERTRS